MNTSLPQIKIVELPSSKNINDYITDDSHLFLPSPAKSISMNDLDSLNVSITADCNSLSSMSQKSVSSGKKKKKPRIIRRLMKIFKIDKPEEAIMIAH